MHEHFFGPQLRARGYEGTNQDVWFQYLVNKGLEERTLPGLENEWLYNQGYTDGVLNDKFYKMYEAAGLSGHIDDMGAKYILPEGGAEIPGEPIPDPLWADVVFFHDFTQLDPITGGTGTLVGRKEIVLEPDGVFNSPCGDFQPATNSINAINCAIPTITLDTVEGFTVDCWGKTIDIGPGNWPTFLELSLGGTTSYYGSSDGRGFTTGGVFGYHPTGANTIPHDNWTHAAYVFGGGRCKIYSEGKLLLDQAQSDLSQSFDSLYIGCRNNGTYPYVFKGKLSQIRITKGQRWTSDFTPPTGPVLVPVGP